MIYLSEFLPIESNLTVEDLPVGTRVVTQLLEKATVTKHKVGNSMLPIQILTDSGHYTKVSPDKLLKLEKI